MIKIERIITPSGKQMDFIIEGMRNPKNSWDRSDSTFDADYAIGENDGKLMHTLAMAGTEHRKFLRMMPIYARITAPLYWWKEFDTYKVGTVTNSCSTMHKIHEKEFTLDDFSIEHLIVEDDVNHIDMKAWMQKQIDILNEWRQTFLDVKDSPISAKNAKNYWWQMIQLLPSSYNQTRNVMINYEVALEIYRQRKNHKLDEWHTFCEFIESLPYINIFMENEEDKNAEEDNKSINDNNKPINGELLRVECDSSGENYAVMSKDGKISRVPIVYMYK